MTHRLLYISCCDVVDGALFGQKWWTLGLGLVRLVLALGLVVAETYRPLHVFFLLQNCLPSHRPLWTDIYPTNIISQWQDEWKSALVVNSSLVDDPTIWQSGFDLCRCHWALLSRFQTNQGHCASCQKKWCLAAVDMCCGVKCQAMLHIVSSCPQTKLERLHSADDVATEWLKTYGS